MPEVVEWGIQYPGEPEPRPAESEWRARSWAEYWNARQIAIDEGLAIVASRTVVASDWSASAECEHDPLYDRSECVNCGNQCAWCSKCGADVCCHPTHQPAAQTETRGSLT